MQSMVVKIPCKPQQYHRPNLTTESISRLLVCGTSNGHFCYLFSLYRCVFWFQHSKKVRWNSSAITEYCFCFNVMELVILLTWLTCSWRFFLIRPKNQSMYIKKKIIFCTHQRDRETRIRTSSVWPNFPTKLWVLHDQHYDTSRFLCVCGFSAFVPLKNTSFLSVPIQSCSIQSLSYDWCSLSFKRCLLAIASWPGIIKTKQWKDQELSCLLSYIEVKNWGLHC